MGLFDFMKGEKKKEPKQVIDLYAPVTGRLIPIEEVSDQVFSTKMLGDGFAVLPEDTEVCQVCAPAAAKVFSVFPTKHAVNFKAGELEVLLHIGLDTVELNGAPFESELEEGQEVQAADPIVEMNIPKVKAGGKDPTTLVVFTNMDELGGKLEVQEAGPVKAGDKIGQMILY